MSDNAADSINLTIDGVALSVPKGTLLVEAAKRVRQEIPVYCYHPKLGPAGLCRVCLVEIEGMPKLQIACNTPVAEGMVVRTSSQRAADGRATILELLLVNHPLDCPICDKGGECDLQDYAMAYARGTSDVADPKTSKPKGVNLGPTIVLDEERCVVCQRCVRFDDIIAGERQLVVKDRGVRDMIATATGDPYRHNFTGNVTELCPVGALTSKTYRFKSRPWDLRRVETSCTQCAVGCRQFVDTRFGTALRTMSVESDDAVSDGWLCDRGRYNIGFYASPNRLTQPLYRDGGGFVQIGWDDAFAIWAKAIKEAVSTRGPASAGVIGGGRLTNEEAYLLQYVFRKAGVRNLDWRAGRQRQAAPGKHGAASYGALDGAQAIVVAGESAAQRAPVMDLRVRKAVLRNGATLIRIAPIERRPVVPCVDVAGAAEAVAAIPQGAARVAVVWDGVDLGLAADLVRALEGRDATFWIASEQGNARGAEAMGMLPGFAPGYAALAGAECGFGTDEMLAAARNGELASLSIFGANPALHHAGGRAVREALQRVTFLAVSDLFLTDTAKLATLVLPATAAFEKTGTTIDIAGDVLPVEQSLDAPDGALSDLEMLVGLGQQLDFDLPTAEELAALVIASAASVPAHLVPGDPRFASSVTALEPVRREGAWRVFPESHIFAGDGTVANDDRLSGLRPLPQVAMSPQSAARLGASSGDYVDLDGGDATLHDLLVEVRPGIADDVVVVTGGLSDDAANVLPAGAYAKAINLRAGADRAAAVAGSGA